MVPLSGWNQRNSSIFWSSASSSADSVYFDTRSIAFGYPSAYEIFISWKQKSFHVEEISRRNLQEKSPEEISRRNLQKKSPGEICIIADIEQSEEESLELMEATELLEQSSDTTDHQNQLDQD